MKIGFYKPFIPIYFHDDSNDLNATSYEVVNVMKIFAEKGHKCYILSGSDLIDGKIKNINNGFLDEKYDRIFLYGGPFNLKRDDGNIINILKEKTKRLSYVLTDLRCIPPRKDYYSLFNDFYSQSTLRYLGRVKNIYGGVAEFRCYKMKFEEYDKSKKDIKIYFGGTTRNRLKKYLEYVYRPNVMITGKSEELKFNNRVKRNEYFDLLRRTRYSIVFADDVYNINYFITPRFYENVEFGIINLVDFDWDMGERIVKLNDWCRVRTYLEMMKKIDELEENDKKYNEILEFQRSKVKKEYITGDYVYEVLQ